MRRGEVWWANLPEPTGSGSGMRRPVLIIQSNPFNESRISTVVVAIITSNLGLADLPGNVRIAKTESGLSKSSIVNVSQLLTIDRGLIIKKAKMLRASSLRKLMKVSDWYWRYNQRLTQLRAPADRPLAALAGGG